MRTWLLILVLAMNIQPLAAESCDMEMDGHAQHGTQLDHGDMDCCDTDRGNAEHDCAQASHCGTCVPAVFALSVKGTMQPGHAVPFDRALAAGQLPPSHSAPPYRPPIS